MKNKITILLLFCSLNYFGQEQKCKLMHDKDTGKDFYTDLDSYPKFKDSKIDESDFISANFKTPNKKYKKNQRVKFIWMVEKTGKSTFLKVLFPQNDADIETEVKRVLSIMPLYEPARCGNDSVTCKIDYEFPLFPKKEKMKVKEKCKQVYDKELGIHIYVNVDSSVSAADEEAFNKALMSDDFKFKGISTKYKEDQMVQMAYLVDVNGKCSLIKVISPSGDKEIEEEAKRLIGLLPKLTPCKCENVLVPCHGGINMRLYPKKR